MLWLISLFKFEEQLVSSDWSGALIYIWQEVITKSRDDLTSKRMCSFSSGNRLTHLPDRNENGDIEYENVIMI